MCLSFIVLLFGEGWSRCMLNSINSLSICLYYIAGCPWPLFDGLGEARPSLLFLIHARVSGAGRGNMEEDIGTLLVCMFRDGEGRVCV
jgi:hypothetical protein